MPFPQQKNLPKVIAEYAHVESDKAADEIAIKVNAAAAAHKIPEGTSARAASVVYLGLCVLRKHSLNGAAGDAQKKCTDILQRYNPQSSGGITVNCSYFKEVDGKQVVVDHLKAIKNACDYYMPRVKSRKKRCFALLVLGAEHAKDIELPETDEWVKAFNFHP